MKTDELILHLAKSAGPVTRLPAPSIRLLQWLAAAAALAAVAVFGVGARAGLGTAISQPAFAVSLAALVLATISAAALAFVLSVPGAEGSPRRRALPIAAGLAWPAAWFVAMMRHAGATGARPFHWACAIEIGVLGAISGWMLVGMLRRAAPLQPAWTAGIAGVAAVTIASAATQVICPVDDPRHQLVGHVLVAAVVGFAVFMAGRRRLTSRRLAS